MASNLSLMVFTTAAIAFATSALERIEDLRQTSRHVRKVPISEVARSFCHPCPAASGIGGISKPDVVAEPRGGRERLPQRAAWKPVFVHVNEFLVDSWLHRTERAHDQNDC